MSYLLDTNTCIRYLNGTSENTRKQFESHTASDLFLCSIVKAELLFGAQKSSNPKKNLKKVYQFFEPFISLPFDDNCAQKYSEVRTELELAGTPIGPNDLLIASIFLSYKFTLITNNVREFNRISNLMIEDWA